MLKDAHWFKLFMVVMVAIAGVGLGTLIAQTTVPLSVTSTITPEQQQLLAESTLASKRNALRYAWPDLAGAMQENQLDNALVVTLDTATTMGPQYVPLVLDQLVAALPQEPDPGEGEGESAVPGTEGETGPPSPAAEDKEQVYAFGEIGAEKLFDYPYGGTLLLDVQDIPAGTRIMLTTEAL